MDANLALARELEARRPRAGRSRPHRRHHASSRVSSASRRSSWATARPDRWKEMWSRSPVDRLIQAADDIDLRIFPHPQANERSRKRLPAGRLKIFLGYAAGVGKTYQMLDEAQELRRKGVDVVIGYFEPHARQDTIALTEGLEVRAAQEDSNIAALLRRDGCRCHPAAQAGRLPGR